MNTTITATARKNATRKVTVGSWTIAPDGTMTHRDPDYYIEGRRLAEGNWIQHMAEKRWVDVRTFIRAYLLACQRRGIKAVTIDTEKFF